MSVILIEEDDTLLIDGTLKVTGGLDPYAIHAGGRPVGSGARMLYDEAVSNSTIATGDYGDGRDYHAFPGAVRLADGELVVVYRSGTLHAAIGDKGILRSQRSKDNGRTWSEPVTVFEDATYDSRDPNISLTAYGTLIISFFRSSFNIDGGSAFNRPQVLRSTDGGYTWSAPSVIPTPWTYNPGASSNPAYQLSNGDLLQTVYGHNAAGGYSTGVSRSTDDGLTWGAVTIVGDIAVRDYNEAGLIETAPGTLMCVMRSSVGVSPPEYHKSVSTDYGVTWGASSLLWDRASGSPKLLKLANGNILIVYRRTGITASTLGMRVSEDDGATWPVEQYVNLPDSGGNDYLTPLELDPGVVALVHAYRDVAETSASVYLMYMLYATATTANGDSAHGLLAARTFYHGGEGSAIFQKGLQIGGPKSAASGGDQRLLWLANGATPTNAPIGGIVMGSDTAGVPYIRAPGEAASRPLARLNTTDDALVLRTTKTVSAVIYRQVLIGFNSDGVTPPASLNNSRGITIQLEDKTDEALTIKAWAIAHGIVNRGTETDTVGHIRKIGTNGGLMVSGYMGGGGTPAGLWLEGVTVLPSASVVPPANAKGVIHVDARAYTTGAIRALTTTERVFSVATNDVTLLVLTAQGDTHHVLAGSGVVLKSPDGLTRASLTIDNTGALITTILP